METSKFIDLKWGTRAPVTVECEDYGMFDLRANGIYVMQIGGLKNSSKKSVAPTVNLTWATSPAICAMNL